MATNVQLHLGDCLLELSTRGRFPRNGAIFGCITCNKPFYRKLRDIKSGDNKFCSRECYFIWQKGRPRSASFGEKCKAGQNKRNATRVRITPINTAIRNSPEMARWRELVFERDNWTCQKCGRRSSAGDYVRIEAHHIKPFATYPKLRFDVSNGLTLCKPCHVKEPKGRQIYGA